MITINRVVYSCVIVTLLWLYWYTYNYSLCVTENLRKLHIPSSLPSDQLLNFRNDGLLVQPINYVKRLSGGASTQSDATGSLMVNFDPTGSDTLVFLHIQKSGGSYFLQKFYSLNVGEPCQVRTKRKLLKEFSWCPRPKDSHFNDTWIFSTKTFGWVCGVHPTWTELNACVPSLMDARFGENRRRYLYLTVLRHPVTRFASEFLHVRRGATWFRQHKCLNQRMTPKLVPPCYKNYYEGASWPNLTLKDFVSCPYNQAINRQTRMIADLTLVDCYKHARHPTPQHDATMLASAKLNLQRKFVGFAINEYLVESQVLLEHQLGRSIMKPFITKNTGRKKSGDLVGYIFRKKELYDKIAELNHLDMKLYQYALELFASRLAVLGITLNKNKLQQEINELEFNEQEIQEQF